MVEPAADFRQQALTHLDALHNFALYLAKSAPAADDLVQETYLRAFRFAHRFEPGTHLRAWLFQILRNTFLTFYRRESRELALLDKDGAPEVEDVGEPGRVASLGTAVDLARAISGLPEEFRSVFLLADLEGFALGDVAQIMDSPVGTVKSRLFRARRLLRQRLSDYRAS